MVKRSPDYGKIQDKLEQILDLIKDLDRNDLRLLILVLLDRVAPKDKVGVISEVVQDYWRLESEGSE